MSFSSEVKAELAKNISSARHCRIAELSGMMSMVADVWYRNGSLFKLCITTERSIIAKTMAALIKVLFDIINCRFGNRLHTDLMIPDHCNHWFFFLLEVALIV